MRLSFLLGFLLLNTSMSRLTVYNTEFDENKQSLFWMHIQKTSSWIGNFLLLWGCKSLRDRYVNPQGDPVDTIYYDKMANFLRTVKCEVNILTGGFPFGYHVSCLPDLKNHVVTLFRKPAERIISAFLHGRGRDQMMFPRGYPERVKVKYPTRANISRSDYPIYAYASLEGMLGCQTKMLMGFNCGNINRLNPEVLEAAKYRLKNEMLFFGLTEESVATAKLFLAMFGNVTVDIVEPSQRIRYRQNVRYSKEARDKLVSDLRVNNWRDPYDEELYEEASKIFYERCKKYKISVKYPR